MNWAKYRLRRKWCMTKMIGAISLLLLFACASAPELTQEERQKIDPPLMKLLSGSGVDGSKIESRLRSDGEKEYEVIIRAKTTEELKSAGIKIQSVIGDVITAHLTIQELRSILKLPSVRSVEGGSQNFPQ
jgi:hypothetical protein